MIELHILGRLLPTMTEPEVITETQSLMRKECWKGSKGRHSSHLAKRYIIWIG